MKWQDHIAINPAVMVGKPVIKGTRITVERILEMLGDGSSQEDILESYPHINAEQIQACLAFAAVAMSSDDYLTEIDHVG